MTICAPTWTTKQAPADMHPFISLFRSCFLPHAAMPILATRPGKLCLGPSYCQAFLPDCNSRAQPGFTSPVTAQSEPNQQPSGLDASKQHTTSAWSGAGSHTRCADERSNKSFETAKKWQLGRAGGGPSAIDCQTYGHLAPNARGAGARHSSLPPRLRHTSCGPEEASLDCTATGVAREE